MQKWRSSGNSKRKSKVFDPAVGEQTAEVQLATAGTGDVLAGIIGSLVAQNLEEPEVVGVQIHTIAAKKILAEGNKTIVASDLLKKISSSIN